jgi:hypothetical protein
MGSDATTPRAAGDTSAPHMSPVSPDEDVRTIMLNRVSWAAVLAGVVAALVTHLLLNMLGLGIGAAALSPVGDDPSPRRVTLLAGLWWTLSGIIASFVGGYMAGRLSGRPKESTGGWHGVTAWAFTTLLIFYLATSAAGNVLGGAYNAIAGAAGGIGRTATQLAAPAVGRLSDPFSGIEQQIREASGGNDPAAMRDTAIASVRALVTGDPAQAQQARERAAQALARAQNIPVEEARARVASYEQQFRAAAEEARRTADQARRVVSRAALWSFFALLLGALAAWFGGRQGTVHPTITDALLRNPLAQRGMRTISSRFRNEPPKPMP